MTPEALQDSLAVKLAAIAIDSFCSPSWEKVAIGAGVTVWLLMALWSMLKTGWWGVKLGGRVIAWPFRETPIDPERPAAHVMVALDGEVKKEDHPEYRILVCPGVCRIVSPGNLDDMSVFVGDERLHLLPHERRTIGRRGTEIWDELNEKSLAESARNRREAEAKAREEQATRDQLAAEELRRRLTAPKRMEPAKEDLLQRQIDELRATPSGGCPGCGGINGFHQSGCLRDPARKTAADHTPVPCPTCGTTDGRHLFEGCNRPRAVLEGNSSKPCRAAR